MNSEIVQSPVARDKIGEPGPTLFQRNGAWPYVNLVYLFFVFLPLLFERNVSATQWIATLIAVAVFLPVYFLGWQSERWQVPVVVANAALAYALIPFNPGGNSLLVYAIAFTGYMFEPRRAIALSVLMVAGLAAEILFLGYPLAYVAITVVIGGMVLSGVLLSRAEARHNAELRLSQEEVQRLARANERERIARDLHDLLGHTLSLIAVKAELARRLCERDAASAVGEIAEVERIARDALSQVRSAVADMRGAGLGETCTNVSAVLNGTGVEVECDTGAALPTLAHDVDQTLGWVLREAVTNILRHAHARRVGISLTIVEQWVCLDVHDDGCGGAIVEGQGLRGMRERLAAHGGTLAVSSDAERGTRLTARVPQHAAASERNANLPSPASLRLFSSPDAPADMVPARLRAP